jgi:Fe-S cluster biogenesis protein NfuA
MTAEWGKLHSEEIHGLYSSRYVRVITYEMGGACSTCGYEEMHTALRWGDLKERVHLQDLDLRQISEKLRCIHL